MDYFERIQNAIEFIEENLQEEIEIVEVASKAFFFTISFSKALSSNFRIFCTGIYKKRRLSEATLYLRKQIKIY